MGTAIQEKVQEIVARQCIKNSLNLRNDLKATNIDIVEIITYLQKEFDVAVPIDNPTKIQTVGDVVAYLTERVHY